MQHIILRMWPLTFEFWPWPFNCWPVQYLESMQASYFIMYLPPTLCLDMSSNGGPLALVQWPWPWNVTSDKCTDTLSSLYWWRPFQGECGDFTCTIYGCAKIAKINKTSISASFPTLLVFRIMLVRMCEIMKTILFNI